MDGDAYYWASVNPATYPDQRGKLAELGRTVHARGGIWIPSAAPGFDARLVGGRSVVARRGGATLREELDAAAASDPDAVGLISWNEFSENTHVEPSVKHGSRYLDVVADVRRATFASHGDFDSSEPAATGRELRRPAARRHRPVPARQPGPDAQAASHPSAVDKSPIVGLWGSTLRS